MYSSKTTGIRSRRCDGGCGKTIIGKGQEFFFRVSSNGRGVNYCSACLRQIATEVDQLNEAKRKELANSIS